MKICIDISQIVYEGSGVANYTRNLVKQLATEGNDEFILFGSSLRKYYLLQNFYKEVIQNKNIDCSLFHIPQTVLSYLWNSIHKFNIENLVGEVDIIHTSDWIEPPSKAIKVTTIHDLVVLKYPQYSNTKIISTQRKRLDLVKKESSLIIADSYATKQDILDYLKIEPHKIKVVYPGIDDMYSPKSQSEIQRIRTKYGLPINYVLSVGTMEPRKNLTTVMQAFEQFLASPLVNDKNIQLVLVGKYGWGDKISNLPPFIKVLGFVDSLDLPAIYSGASLFIYPSFYEGFGFPILEAMACGTPVITSERGSLKEIGGTAATYINPEDKKEIASKMVNLFIDKEKRAKVEKIGVNWTKQFNWRNTAEKTLAVYHNLFTKRNN